MLVVDNPTLARDAVGPSTPTIQHHSGLRQHLTLQPPQTCVAVAQHSRGCLRVDTCRSERLPERLGRSDRARAREGEAVLAPIGMDHLTRDHLEATPLGPVPVSDIAAIQPDHDRIQRRRRRRVHGLGGMCSHDILADPQRPVAHRAGVLRPADRQQLRQQRRCLAERHKRGISGRDIGELGGDTITTKVECSNAFRLVRALTRADEPAPHPHRHVAEQGPECRPVVAPGREPAPAHFASLRICTQSRHLRRHDHGLQRRRELLRFGETEPEVSHADLRITLNAGELGLNGHARLVLGHQLHPPLQLRHRRTLVL